MRIQNYLYIVHQNLARKPIRALLAIITMAVAVAIVCMSVALALGIQIHILGKLNQAFPERILIASPQTMDISLVRVDTTQITEETIARIRAFPGVDYVAPQLTITFPVRAEGSIFGTLISTDVVVNGVPRELVATDLAPDKEFCYNPDLDVPVPALISRYFIDIYNSGYARSQNLPQFNPAAVIGRQFELILGESTLAELTPPGKVQTVTCEVVGLTPNTYLLGLIIPLDYVREFNRWYHGDDVTNYTHAHVALASLNAAPQVREKLESLGLQVESNKDILDRFRLVANVVTGLVLFFSGCVVLISLYAMVNMFTLILIERRGEIGLMRTIGGSRRKVLGIYALEASLIGMTGGIMGTAVSWVLARLANRLLLSVLPPLYYVPDRLFVFSLLMVIGGILFAVLMSTGTTYPLVRRAISQPPARLLTMA